VGQRGHPRAARGEEIVSYQQPPDDPYRPQHRQPSFTPGPQGQPSYIPPQGQQPLYRKPQEPNYGQGEMQPAVRDQRAYPPRASRHGHRALRQAAGKQYALRGAESFWYILGCIGFGVAYFSKLPGKKAACEVFSELQQNGQGPSRSYSLRGAETFWYVLMCIAFGSGYFTKVSAKKAPWEVVGMVQSAPGEYAEAIRQALSGPTAQYPPGF
jgi:hypothetical protein